MARGCVARSSGAGRRGRRFTAALLEHLEPRHLLSGVGGFTGAGLVGQYFTNTSLSGTPAFTRTDVRIDADWDGASPAGSSAPGFANFPGTGWSAKWTGSIIVAYSQTYTFTTVSDDGIRVIVNGQTLINDWTDHSATTDSGSIKLTAGETYSIEVDYYQDTGSSEAHLMWSSPSTPQEVIEVATPIGINGGTAADYDNSLMFADAVKMSRGWTPVNDPWGTAIDFTTSSPNGVTDPNGWPTMDAALPLFDATDRDGTYTLTFNGIATLSTSGSYVNAVISNQQYNPATNTTTATITLGDAPADSSSFALIFTNTQRTATSATDTGVTNVTLMRPVTEGATTSIAAGTLFTPSYEALLSNFTTIRFMDYLNTNNSTVTTWSERTLPGDVTQNQPNGGSLEYAVELANETGKDLWINVPFGADDQYVTDLANLLKYGSDGVNPYTSVQANPVYPPLNSGLKVYVEYSNENWNFNSSQADAAAIAAAGAGDPINYDGIYPTSDSGGWTIAQRWVAERSMEISNLFRNVYGDSEMPGTSSDPVVRPVFEWQYGGSWGEVGLDFLNDYYDNADGIQHVSDPHPVNYYFWGGGGAWYSNTNDDGAATIDAIYASGLADPTTVLSDVQLATQFGLEDVGYEGGFKIGDDSATPLEIQAGVDPRAEAMTLATINYFFAAGGALPVVYTASGAAHYNYGVEQDASGNTTIFSQNTPKMQAYLAAEQALPASVTNGYTLPASSDQPLVIDEGDIFSQSYTSAVATYLLNATVPGTYTVTIQGTADSTLTTEHFMLNGQDIGTIALPIYSAVPDVGTSSAITFTVVAAGLYDLSVYDDGPTRIQYTGNLTISSVSTTTNASAGTGTPGLPELPGALVNVTTGGTASASDQNSPDEGAAQAFDGDDSTKWLAFEPTAWLQYQFSGGTAQIVTQYTMTSANDDYGRDPASWQVLGSNDGINWTLVDSESDQTFSGREMTNTYVVASPGSYSYYRLNVTANTGGGYVQLAEWTLYANPVVMLPTPTPPAATPTGPQSTLITGGTASASDQNGTAEGAAQAFDNNSSTKWLAFSPTAWLQYAAPNGQAYVVTQYSITSANDDYGRDPADWQLLGSNDGITWTVLDTQADQSFSGRETTNTYTIANTTAYQYYQLNITANDGGGYVQLADLNLFGSVLNTSPIHLWSTVSV